MHPYAYLAFDIANERTREAREAWLLHGTQPAGQSAWRRAAAAVLRPVRSAAGALGHGAERLAGDLNRNYAAQE